ncbi:MAG: transposase [Thermoleophilaceae bacterium]
MALFLDACYLPTRPSGAKEGVLVAWGYDVRGERVLLAVRLGQREREGDWLDLGRDLVRRGLRAPLLSVGDGAPGLINALEKLWPESDRGRCAVHRLRNILAKLPEDPALQERVRAAYWAALDEAADAVDGERRLWALVGELAREHPSAAACLAEDLPVLTVHLRYPALCDVTPMAAHASAQDDSDEWVGTRVPRAGGADRAEHGSMSRHWWIVSEDSSASHHRVVAEVYGDLD